MCWLLTKAETESNFGTEMQEQHFQNAFLLGCGIETQFKTPFSEITLSLLHEH